MREEPQQGAGGETVTLLRKGIPTHTDPLEQFFGEGGDLSQVLPGYEYRPEQVQAAALVRDAIKSKSISVIDVGTGVGKSFAYLEPSLHWLKENPTKRVLISTGTRALQNQLILKDVPVALRAMGLQDKIKVSSVVGSSNYLCLRRAQFLSQSFVSLFEDTSPLRQELDRVLQWSETTPTGLLDELRPRISKALRAQVQRDPDTCANSACAYQKMCFSKQARDRYFRSNLLVTNHYLLSYHILSDKKKTIFPKWGVCIVDEAHALEGAVINHFSSTISFHRVTHLMSEFAQLKEKKGLFYLLRFSKDNQPLRDQLFESLKACRTHAVEFFSALPKDGGQDLTAAHPFYRSLHNTLVDFAGLVSRALPKVEVNPETRLAFDSALSRINAICTSLKLSFSKHPLDYMVFVEPPRHAESRFPTICFQALESKSFFKSISKGEEHAGKSFCFLSGALSLSKNNTPSFDYILNKWGFKPDATHSIGSPFDYKNNTRLFVDSKAPVPPCDADKYTRHLTGRLIPIINATKGMTLALFTNFKAMAAVYDQLREANLPYPILMQGDLDSHEIADRVRETPGQVILGTNTFWLGMDLPGSLRCVVITKLPFGVPDDPINKAIFNLIKTRGGEPFKDYALPEAGLMLKQGFGRLVRGSKDWGGVAVLDPRLDPKERRYAKTLLSALPPAGLETDFDRFLEFISSNPLVKMGGAHAT